MYYHDWSYIHIVCQIYINKMPAMTLFCGQNQEQKYEPFYFFRVSSRVFVLIGYFMSGFCERRKKRPTLTHKMSLIAGENIESLVLLYLMHDAKEGWGQWAHVAFVNKAWRDDFKTHKTQLLDYRLDYLT